VSPSLLDLRFLALLVAVAAARKFVPDRRLGLFGALASVAAVAIASPSTAVALVGVAVLYVWPLAVLISRTAARDEARARRTMRWGVAGLVALLVVFKVETFFRLPFLDAGGFGARLLQIVGLSYFLFRAIDYLYMQALAKSGAGPLSDLLFYLVFPTTLTSGPIQKYLDFRKELAAPRPLDAATAGTAAYRVTKGYFYKLVLGYVSLGATHALLSRVGRMHGWDSLAVTVTAYFYFFFDFAGYCHIAIGLGLLLGIKVPENFRLPFLATSITEFWRNWHITLVEWFRDHMFIPLGGMRASRLKASVLAFFLMVLVGLWHGLTVSCLVWGSWHGLLLFVEGMSGSKPMPPARRHGPRWWARIVWTNLRVALGELLFLASPGVGTWSDFWRVAEGFVTWW